MDNQNEHFRHIMHFYFKQGKNAAKTCKKICAVYDEDAVKECVCQKWFARFRCGHFSVKDKLRSGQPNEIDSDKLKAMIDSNPHYTTREIADVLLISKSSVENHLHHLGYVSRLDVWVPHELSEAHLIQRISISDSFGKREK
ncbi:histone-lysine N-methyltransferase SETMAR-like [Temnothorax longispinosus]|uniref:histone-lysine N-methyltransferase SETMAR-like n=1 Tax=Temnothorax longispinosus TaxID=300112 RepID=UPI003A9A321F